MLPQASIQALSQNLQRLTTIHGYKAASCLRLYAHTSKCGLDAHISVGNNLVPMLVEAGLMSHAQTVFYRLRSQKECSFNSLITGYVKCGESRLALDLYDKMLEDSLHPSKYAFAALVKSCTKLKDVLTGCKLHAQIVARGLIQQDIVVATSLIDMYVKCGMLKKAQDVFDTLPVLDVVSWTALISGYTQHGFADKALNCFEQMKCQGFSPNAYTFSCALNACGIVKDIGRGEEIHEEIERQGLLQRNAILGTALIDMYAQCGLLDKAQDALRKLPIKDTAPWTALISGFVEHGLNEEAINCFKHMQHQGVPPNAATFVCTVNACGNIGAIESGEELHTEISKRKLLEGNLVIGSALIEMYSKCGNLKKAQELFDTISGHDVVSWTSLIAAYVQHGQNEEALACFQRMQIQGVYPDVKTLTCILKACGHGAGGEKGRELHAEIARKGLLEKDQQLGNALVDMYVKCGLLIRAQEVFHNLPSRNTVTWTTLISGYAHYGLMEDALTCFENMKSDGMSPDSVAFVCAVNACGAIGAVDMGECLHHTIEQEGLLQSNLNIANALIDMYGRWGIISKAHKVFNQLPVRDVVSWNALMTGYAQLGDFATVSNLYERMKREGIKPDAITFLSVLTACNHTGLVDQGLSYFEAMESEFFITPTIEHFTCIVELLGRAGQLNRALTIMKKLAPDPDIVMWLTLLGACQKWGDTEVGLQAFKKATELDRKEPAVYVCMSNIFRYCALNESL